MAWTTPKTDWSATSVGGVYTGDYFDYIDFNRIVGNLEVLTGLAQQLFMMTFSGDLPDEKGRTDYPYAADMNAIENRLHEINDQTIGLSIGQKRTFTNNGVFINATELNRIESAILSLYEPLTDMVGGRRMLSFRLGTPAGSIRD